MTNEACLLNEEKLEVLRRASRRRPPARIGAKHPELSIYAELVDTEHLDGWVTIGADGKPLNVLNARITCEGEEYLEQFDESTVPATVVLSALFRPRQLLGGLGSACALMVVLFFGFKMRENPAHAEEKSAEPLQEIIAPRQTSPSVETFFGVCGIPPVK